VVIATAAARLLGDLLLDPFFTITAFTFCQRRFINSSSISNKIEKDVLVESVELSSLGNSHCIVATGTFNHKISKQSGDDLCFGDQTLEPFQTCYQYANNDAKYCWTTSVYNNHCNEACKPVDSSTGGWHFVPWYYVNPHQTCGEPCTELEKPTL